MELLAADLRRRIAPSLANHLVWFALPLAARRALDGARFLAEAGKPSAATIQSEQARLYGQANYAAVEGRWGKVADVVKELARLEEELIASIRRCP